MWLLLSNATFSWPLILWELLAMKCNSWLTFGCSPFIMVLRQQMISAVYWYDLMLLESFLSIHLWRAGTTHQWNKNTCQKQHQIWLG